MVRFALHRYGSVDAALTAFEDWQRSRKRFCDVAPEWGLVTRRVVWAYPATQLLVTELQTMHENGIREPASERFSEFFENTLSGLRMKVPIAFVALEFGFEFPVIGDLARFIPLLIDVVATDVPGFRRGMSELVEVVAHLPWIGDRRLEGSDGTHRNLYFPVDPLETGVQWF